MEYQYGQYQERDRDRDEHESASGTGRRVFSSDASGSYRNDIKERYQDRNRGWSDEGQNRFRSDSFRSDSGYPPEEREMSYQNSDRDRNNESWGLRNDGRGQSGRSSRADYYSGSYYGEEGDYRGNEWERGSDFRRDSNRYRPGSWSGAGSARVPGIYQTEPYGFQDERSTGHRGKGPKGFEHTDERLKERICERLTDDDRIDASDVSVSVSGTQVTLEGAVDSRRTKYEIEECAEACGAKEIVNHLKIRSADRPGDGRFPVST